MSDFISKPVNDTPEPKEKHMDADKKEQPKNEEPKKETKAVVATDSKESKSTSEKDKKAARKVGRQAAKEEARKELTHGKDADALRDDRVTDLKSVSLLKASMEEQGKLVNDEAKDYRPDYAKAADKKD